MYLAEFLCVSGTVMAESKELTMADVYGQRRERLREFLRAGGLSCFLVTDAASRYYFSGFELHDPQCNESAGRLIVGADGEDWLCTDARYLDAARRLWPAENIFIYSAESALDMGKFFTGRLSGVLGFEAKSVSLAWWEVFYGNIRGVTMRQVDGLLARLRVIKDADELDRMRRSCALNEAMMRWLPGFLREKEGLDEASLAWAIERYFREHGATELAFASIVAFGKNGALPHAIPSPAVSVAAEGPLLVDVGCRLDGYCSDQTRVFWVGERPSDVYQKNLDRVREAQRRAIAAIRPGVPACTIFQKAWDYFVSEGCEHAFTHSLGHGVGLETHEAPSLNARAETLLEPGMVVTVEPGLYYPEWGGVRWEYMVVVTDDGCEILGS